MQIKTKFNVGDKVWVIGKKENNDEFYIVKGNIKIHHYDTKIKGGVILEDDLFFGYFENDCFATKEEAQAECDKRNKGE